MTWIINIIIAILRALVSAFFNQIQSRPTCEDAKRQPELKARLKNKIKSAGWKTRLLIVLVIILLLPGCFGNRTVYIPSGEPVRLRETIKNAKIWTLDKEGKPVAGKMDLPEGWYCLEDPGS